MNLRLVILAGLFLAPINCQYDDNYQNVVDQTHELEKYAVNHRNQSNISFYPSLQNLTDRAPIMSGSQINQFNDTMGGQQQQVISTERFLNKTVTTMAKGICIKEVPTASLLRRKDVFVAGNGSDPSLSRIQVCCEGYQRNIYNFKKCDPICTKDCINGYCYAPDTCLCYPDHVRNVAGYCIPTCPIGCGNGICTKDNLCLCKEGYILESNGKFCIPKCSAGCQNGNCTAPEICKCFEGFSLSSLTGKCEAVCRSGCQNGNCIAPDVCECKKGYSKVDGVCQPVCTRGCQNGICSAPEICTCSGNGWSLDSTGTKCIASCDKTCLNGFCNGPNQCSCHSGYELDSFDPFRCIPKCDPPCANGVCSGPNLCLCYPGYTKDRSMKGSQKCIRA